MLEDRGAYEVHSDASSRRYTCDFGTPVLSGDVSQTQ